MHAWAWACESGAHMEHGSYMRAWGSHHLLPTSMHAPTYICHVTAMLILECNGENDKHRTRMRCLT
eukprot:365874-Chlamydomonas_euryale.AAC.4